MSSVPITARFPAQEAARLLRAVRAGGGSVSDFMRAAVREKIEHIGMAEQVEQIGRRAVQEIQIQTALALRQGQEREAALAAFITGAFEGGEASATLPPSNPESDRLIENLITKKPTLPGRLHDMPRPQDR